MTAPAKPKPPAGNRRGVVQRFTGKVGPLPVWAWALLILVVGYLVYRLTGAGTSSSSSSTDAAPADTTGQVSGDTTGSPPASGQGGAADNLSGDVLTQLSGLAGQVDALTGLIQSTPAFGPGDGSAGSGATAPNDGSSPPAAPAAKAPAVTVTKPAAAPHAPARVRYYTFRPGQAPKGHKKDEAPAKGPAGTTLHFARGKGYYYA